MARAFLDANVLFSAAYREGAGLLVLWNLEEVELLTSGYAAEEARRNLETPEAQKRLDELLDHVQLVAEELGQPLPPSLRIAEKDRPILQAAIAAQATHLVTGELRDFGPLFGKRVTGVLIQTPAEFLRKHRKR